MCAFLSILWMWRWIRTKKYFLASWKYEFLNSPKIFWFFKSRFAMKMWIEGMTTFFVMSSEEEVLGSDSTIEIWIFLWSHEFCHITSRDVLDDDGKFWEFLRDSLSECAKFSLSSMDKPFGDMSVRILGQRSFRMKRQNDITFDHCFKYFSGFWIFWINIACWTTTIGRDTSWIIFHSTDFSFTGVDSLRCCCRFQRNSHDRSRSLWQEFFQFRTIYLYFLCSADVIGKEIGHRKHTREMSLQRTYSPQNCFRIASSWITWVSIVSTKVSMEVTRRFELNFHENMN